MLNQFCLRMGTELVPETLYSNELTRLCAREDYIESCRRESFKTYNFIFFSHVCVWSINTINQTSYHCPEMQGFIKCSLFLKTDSPRYVICNGYADNIFHYLESSISKDSISQMFQATEPSFFL
jgi:hypothetical protein